MRRMMAAEKAAAAKRGEPIDETSEASMEEEDDDCDGPANVIGGSNISPAKGVIAAAAAVVAGPAMTAMGLQLLDQKEAEREAEAEARLRKGGNPRMRAAQKQQHNR